MGLNGWQRLWVVVVVMWLLPVIVFSYELWPTTANVFKNEVYAQLKPDDGRRLSDYIVTSQSGGTIQIDFSKYVGKGQPRPAGAIDYDALAQKYGGRSEPLPGPVLDIDGHKAQFNEGVSPEDVNQTTRAYTVILRHILSAKRAAFIGRMFAIWMAPAIALYLVGWGIAWVRRGFRQVA